MAGVAFTTRLEVKSWMMGPREGKPQFMFSARRKTDFRTVVTVPTVANTMAETNAIIEPLPVPSSAEK